MLCAWQSLSRTEGRFKGQEIDFLVGEGFGRGITQGSSVSEAYFSIWSSFMCETQQAPCPTSEGPRLQRGAVYPRGPRGRGDLEVRGRDCHSFSSYSHSHQNLQGECPQIACVFCFDVATVWPPRLTLGQLNPMVQAWLSNFGNWEAFPRLPGLGVYLP